MELFYQACEVAATGSEVVMMLYLSVNFLDADTRAGRIGFFNFYHFS